VQSWIFPGWVVATLMAKSYWDYYQPDYEWEDEGMFPIDMKASEEAFSRVGFSDAQVTDLVRSGYVVESGLVIDLRIGLQVTHHQRGLALDPNSHNPKVARSNRAPQPAIIVT
jgi:hypothetical protein